MVLFWRRERCDARKDDGSVHRTLSKSDRRIAARSSLLNTLDASQRMQPD